MKTITHLILCSFLLISQMACKSSDDTPLTINEYILSVDVLNKEVGKITIDNFAKQITIEMIEGQNKSDVRIKLSLASNVNMVSPSTDEAVYDLQQQQTIRLSAANKELSFSIKAKDIEGETPSANYKGWTLTEEFGTLPDGINVYKSPNTINGKNAVAYIAVADINKGKIFDVLGEATGLKTPSQFYESTNKIYPVVINGGYFWSNTNLSLLCRNGEFVSKNNQVVTRKNAAGVKVSFYPTRGVFGNTKDNKYSADWVFTTVTPETTFAYPEPALNKSGSDPQPVPSATYPAGAWVYKPQTAIGGGPVLVKNGILKNTWEAELYDADSGIGAANNNPRTAIGITADNKLILFVCEGRNQTPNTPGYTLEEVANIMIDLGCTEALNLDGGGSTCMLVNGKETIKPSDSGNKQRPVASAVVLR